VERDLMLVQVSTKATDGQGSRSLRSEILELVSLFRAKVVDVSTDQIMIEMSGTEEKLEAFIELIRPYGVIELARTGIIAMPRGNPGVSSRAQYVRTAGGSASGPAVDVGDLPPG